VDDKLKTAEHAISLQSMVDSHEHPFVVIDRDYKIVAVNVAYEQVYGTARDWAVGRPCYKISHNNDLPCDVSGEECPHRQLFETGKSATCLHIHYDDKHRMHQVRVKGFPLEGPGGDLYLGELVEELSPPEDRRLGGHRMVGSDRVFTACLEQLSMVAASDAPVLLQGETGTGKELAAAYVHQSSNRSGGPFLTMDCTVLTETLFEAEVFGHSRGAFTGSVGEKPGLFEQADGGTLLLDEIGELPASQQAKLLRVLESGEFRRVGGRKPRKSNVRIICATNRHLWEAVMNNTFREDLYYRIACLSVRLPSLRERLNDIPTLATNLLERVNHNMGRSFKLAPDAIDRLMSYHYPGNIRELRNILSVAATHGEQGSITGETIDRVIEHLNRTREQFRKDPGTDAPPREAAGGIAEPAASTDSLQDIEARHIYDLLRRHAGNRKRVSAALGISERTLYRKLKRYGLT